MSKGFIIALVIVVVIILVLLFLIRNRKDKKQLEEELKQNYKKPKTTGSDIDIEEKDSI